MSTKFLDPIKYSLVIGGVPVPLVGLAEDSHIKFQRDAPVYTDQVGVDGQVVRVRSHDNRGTLTISFMQTSESNALLSTILQTDMASDNGAGVGPFLLKDQNGLTVIESPESWISSTPDNEQGKTATQRDWVVRIADCGVFEGGN